MFVCLFVCLSVCPLAYLKNNQSKLHQVFFTFFLGPPPTAMRYVISGFVDDVMFSYNGGNRPESKTTRMFRPVCQLAAPAAKSTVWYILPAYKIWRLSLQCSGHMKLKMSHVTLTTPHIGTDRHRWCVAGLLGPRLWCLHWLGRRHAVARDCHRAIVLRSTSTAT